MSASLSSSREEHGDGQSLLREFGDAHTVETYMNTDIVDVKDRGIGTCMSKWTVYDSSSINSTL